SSFIRFYFLWQYDVGGYGSISWPKVGLDLSTGVSYQMARFYAGRNWQRLEWAAQQKIAVGAARGLRYLHEECRVGCIVHRDMRPNNILITHDFEPLVWNSFIYIDLVGVHSCI
ncbi:hypothetical protein IFM89_013105, partial [Coptis chinensis]